MKVIIVTNRITGKIDVITADTLMPLHSDFTGVNDARDRLVAQGHRLHLREISNHPYLGRIRYAEYKPAHWKGVNDGNVER